MAAQPLTTRADVVLAGALAALGVAEACLPFSTVMGEGSRWLAATLAGTTALALAVRRRHPLPVLAFVFVPWAVAAAVVPVLILFWGALAPMAVAAYSVARHGVGGAPYAGAGLAAASLVAFTAGTGMIARPGELFFPWLTLATAWTAGSVIRRKQQAAAASEEHAQQVEASGREQTLAALADERARIARELHDVVAHSVTAIVVQAGAAGEVLDDDPEYVRGSLIRIRRTGTEALDEMRRVVTLLRDSDDTEPAGPQPGLADLSRLVAGVEGDRPRVTLQIEGAPRALPVGADLAAFRIVQEAVTNALRHADATRIQVVVRYRRSAVEVEVVDDGHGRQPALHEAATPVGHGQLGMRERAQMYGGEVSFTTGPGQGFHVRARLPLEAAP